MLRKMSFAGTALVCLALNAPAKVQVTKFDPPLTISAFPGLRPGPQPAYVLPEPGSLPVHVLPVDFNLDDNVDFRLTYGLGAIEAYFNAPTSFAFRTSPPPGPGQPIPASVQLVGPVGAVPFGSVIGSNIISSAGSSYFRWSPGFTNQDGLTQPLGDHDAQVLSLHFNTTAAGAQSSTSSVVTTNIPFPVVSGDVVGKEGVMALEFYINGQPHYGYIQFDFRSKHTPFGGTGGFIYGWAYETDPGVPIVAVPIGGEREHPRHGRRSHRPDSSFER